MKILYISSTKAGMLGQSIYYDLMQEFIAHGHEVYCVYANEKRFGLGNEEFSANNIKYLAVETGNLSKNSNLVSKGIATLTIDPLFKKRIKKHLSDIQFDLILVSTPPITFTKTLSYFKHLRVPIYLMLKDIFPQNAVDLQMFKNNGLIHKFFKTKESKSYESASLIGCMSKANMQFISNSHPQFRDKVRLLPNAIKLIDTDKKRGCTKTDFGFKNDDLLLLYGGNIGLPQDPDFIKKCILELEKISGVKLLIAGSGSHINDVDSLVTSKNIRNTKLLGHLDVETYDNLVAICDVGLIFLDHRFTIPNYPQRLLSYLKVGKPVICATDEATDIGKNAQEGNYGLSIPSIDAKQWIASIIYLRDNEDIRVEMGQNGLRYLKENFEISIAYDLIINQLKENHYV